MMSYDEREKWIRNKIVMRNSKVMKAGTFTNQIFTQKEPTKEMVQLGDNWKIELVPGSDEEGWYLDIYEKSTEREFTIYINRE